MARGSEADFSSKTYFASAAPIYTAVKHVHIEEDKMWANGGIIGLDATKDSDKIYISKFYDSATLQWLRVDTINNDNKIHIFDSENTFEKRHDIAYALITNEDYEDIYKRHFVEITLKDAPGGNNYQLQRSYSASIMGDKQSNYAWKFDDGKSAGVCVDDNQFYKADATDLAQPSSDAHCKNVSSKC